MVLNIRSPEYRANPYPAFRRLRAEAPVCQIEPHGHWAIARYADVLSVLRNPKLFSSANIGDKPADRANYLAQTRALIGEDPPAHTRLRGLINKAFVPGRVTALEPHIRSLAQSLLQTAIGKGEFDFVKDFAMPLPVIVIAELLGIDSSRTESFNRWSHTLITWRNAELITDLKMREEREQEIARDLDEMLNYFTEIIDERRHRPKSDLISGLIQACDADQKLSPQEVLSFLRVLLVAGNETTTNLLGNTALALLSQPNLWEQVKQEESLVPKLIEETLRFDSPALSLMRRATEDTEIAGIGIAKDEIVLPLLASANHDETMYENPGVFELQRGASHLSFGGGIHFCLGAPLARLQARVAFEEVFRTFAKITRPESGPVELLDSFFFRGPKQLKLSFLRN